eukprot:362200-Chlamydomonas_euryale.AAC.2
MYFEQVSLVCALGIPIGVLVIWCVWGSDEVCVVAVVHAVALGREGVVCPKCLICVLYNVHVHVHVQCTHVSLHRWPARCGAGRVDRGVSSAAK